MIRAFLYATALLTTTSIGVAQQQKDGVLEGNLQRYERRDFDARTPFCGTYFVLLPADKPGMKDGVAFRLLMFGAIPTDIMTAWERITLTIDAQNKIPWASVELRTGMMHAQFRVSEAALKEMPCLAKAKRS